MTSIKPFRKKEWVPEIRTYTHTGSMWFVLFSLSPPQSLRTRNSENSCDPNDPSPLTLRRKPEWRQIEYWSKPSLPHPRGFFFSPLPSDPSVNHDERFVINRAAGRGVAMGDERRVKRLVLQEWWDMCFLHARSCLAPWPHLQHRWLPVVALLLLLLSLVVSGYRRFHARVVKEEFFLSNYNYRM